MTVCAGLKVVEIVGGTSELLGLAGGVPGMVLADLGAEVTRVVAPDAPDIDRGLEWGRVWHRDKTIVHSDSPADFAAGADVVLVYCDVEIEPAEGQVVVRLEPDFPLLVEARSGFCSQLAGHRDGPIMVDVRAAETGAAAIVLVEVFALLLAGGGRVRTTLYDGMLATLGCMIGRSERAAAEIEYYWEHGSTFPNFMYRCADGELLQVWFGGKGMYAALIGVLGDEPSAEGYYADQMAGRLGDRARRWTEFFARRPRDEWITDLRAAGVACEPILGPAEALADPHLAEIGLAMTDGADTVLGSPIAVAPATGGRLHDRWAGTDGHPTRKRPQDGRGALAGLRVVDFAAFVAGPLAAQVLADLGADVVKIEPPTGEAMRAAAYAIAACQRGKRSLAMDLGAPETRPVVERLLDGADVVLHNFRVGVAERLGIGADEVARRNPGAVYCHASAFGGHGPRAKFPGNDALMQAVTGLERAIGGATNDPIAGTWIPIDMAGGWVAAAGILAGLYGRSRTGAGQQVVTSLLGAGMLIHSGAFLRDGSVVRGPELDAAQTGYGPGYRLYEGSDGQWFALVTPSETAWKELAAVAGVELGTYAPLEHGPDEATLAAAFEAEPAARWTERLGATGVLAELAPVLTRDEFRSRILADPERSVAYETRDWGHFEQLAPFVGRGRDTDGPPLRIPGVGEHSIQILHELGFTDEQVTGWTDAKVVRG